MEEKEFIRVGIIGCGWITKNYKFMTKFIKNTKIVAATDLNINLAKKVCNEDQCYIDAQEMYDKEEIDAVYIATPHFLHKPMIKQAFENGVHIMCEKPVGVSVEDAREISELDKKYSNLKLGFNYNYRYDQKCHQLVSGIRKGHIGKVYYANCSVFFSRNEDYFKQGDWRTKRESAGGGTLMIHGSHIVDIMLWAMGEPKSAIGRIDTMKHGTEVEDLALGIVEFENGAYAQINNSSFVYPRKNKINDIVELEIFGDKGRVFYRGPWPTASIEWKGVKKLKMEKDTKGISHFGRSIKAFGNWILHDKPYHNTIEESSRVLRLISAIYKSSESGKKEPVEKL